MHRPVQARVDEPQREAAEQAEVSKPLSGECLDPVRLGVVEGYVHEGGWASLQDWDQASGPEPARGQRLQSHLADPLASS